MSDSLTGGQLQETFEGEDGETRTRGIQLSEEQRTSEAQATTEASVGGNLSADIARGDSVQFDAQFTNSNGGTETVGFRATRTGDSEFKITAQDPQTGENALRATVSFDGEGNVESSNIQENSGGFDGLSVESQSGENVQVEAEDLDFSGLSFGQGDGETTAGVTSRDGRSSGELSSLSLTENGQLQGEFSNGETRNFGEVATAQFEDSSSLTGLDNGTFLSNGLSGEADFSAETEITSGELETQGSDNTQSIADNVLGAESAGNDFGGRNRGQLVGSIFDLSV